MSLVFRLLLLDFVAKPRICQSGKAQTGGIPLEYVLARLGALQGACKGKSHIHQLLPQLFVSVFQAISIDPFSNL